jgi:hypothetical protein
VLQSQDNTTSRNHGVIDLELVKTRAALRRLDGCLVFVDMLNAEMPYNKAFSIV